MASAGPCWGHRGGGDLQGHGLGRRVIEELLHTPAVVAERVYLMTTKSGLLPQLGQDATRQQLMVQPLSERPNPEAQYDPDLRVQPMPGPRPSPLTTPYRAICRAPEPAQHRLHPAANLRGQPGPQRR